MKLVGEELNMHIDDKNSHGVKLRYRSTILCDVEIIDDKAIIKLKEPAFGLLVDNYCFYDENRVIGSAF